MTESGARRCHLVHDPRLVRGRMNKCGIRFRLQRRPAFNLHLLTEKDDHQSRSSSFVCSTCSVAGTTEQVSRAGDMPLNRGKHPL
uniref:Uncharacterized protein n=1 Tax=Peronospora matthiolae TaxID=2874970 RepID=A0AAV1TKK4_9STRA